MRRSTPTSGALLTSSERLRRKTRTQKAFSYRRNRSPPAASSSSLPPVGSGVLSASRLRHLIDADSAPNPFMVFRHRELHCVAWASAHSGRRFCIRLQIKVSKWRNAYGVTTCTASTACVSMRWDSYVYN
ncbi:hypothetical protein GPALN_010314 [Globodera pallida]|nr:hypothetical protein GPALN_010314 [Globodera pallida]